VMSGYIMLVEDRVEEKREKSKRLRGKEREMIGVCLCNRYHER